MRAFSATLIRYLIAGSTMSDPTFAQSERRRAAPIFVAAAVLAAIAIAVFYLNPRDTAALSISDTHAVGIRTNLKSDSIIINAPKAGEDDLYVMTTVHIANHLRLPITVDTMLCTLVTSEGQEATASAATKEDLPIIYTTFPQLKSSAGPALLREATIGPGTSGEGQVVFHFPITKTVWDARKSATLEIDLYHQKPQTILIP